MNAHQFVSFVYKSISMSFQNSFAHDWSKPLKYVQSHQRKPNVRRFFHILLFSPLIFFSKTVIKHLINSLVAFCFFSSSTNDARAGVLFSARDNSILKLCSYLIWILHDIEWLICRQRVIRRRVFEMMLMVTSLKCHCFSDGIKIFGLFLHLFLVFFSAETMLIWDADMLFAYRNSQPNLLLRIIIFNLYNYRDLMTFGSSPLPTLNWFSHCNHQTFI